MDRSNHASGNAGRRARRLGLVLVLGLAASPLRAQDEGPRPVAATTNAVTLASAPPAPDQVIMLRLRDGGIHFGAVADHDANDLRFTLLATGGTVAVPWTLLDPAQSLELRTQFGYVDVAAEELLVDGERLVLVAGGVVEGVIVSRDGTSFHVKTDGNVQVVPASRVAAVEGGLRIPALDVYSTDELYSQYAASADPTDAASQWQLAELCERIFAFDRAVAHYKQAAQLDPTYRAEELRNMLPRVEEKALQQAQLTYLREADRLRKQGKWDKALAALKAFPSLYPQSPLEQDARKQEARLLLARDEAAKELVAKSWKHWMRRLTRDLALEENFIAARTYVDEKLSEEIQKHVLADLQREIHAEAQLEEVRKLWQARKKVRYDATTYSHGTWLLGKEAAQRGAEGASAEPTGPAGNELDQERDALKKRIEQFLKNQQIASRGKRAEEQEDAAQQFWLTFPRDRRSTWLLAYYIENSGDLELRPRADLSACRTCGGRGAIETLLTGGTSADNEQRSQLQECPSCRGVQIVRRVNFR